MTFSGGGSGTEADPYEIENWHHLDEVRDDLLAHYVLMNDLDENTDGYDDHASETANDGAGWEPIGTTTYPFEGGFDGGYNYIIDLYSDRSGDNYISLMGYCGQDSIIRNLFLSGANITGWMNVGGLTSINYNVIERCSVIDCVITGDSKIGGLTSENSGDIVNSCVLNTTLNGGSYIGGFTYSNSEQELQGQGSPSSSTPNIIKCYSVVDINFDLDEGVGTMAGSNTSIIEDCLAEERKGVDIIGMQDGTLNGRVTDAPEEDMQNILLYTDNDFKDYDALDEAWDIETIENWDDHIWHIDDGNDYPRLGEPPIPPEPEIKAYTNIDGNWVEVKVKTNIGGTWVEVETKTNIGGDWE